MTALIAMLGGVRAAAFAGIAAVLLLMLGVQTWRITAKDAKLEKQTASLALFAEAQKTNMATIKTLKDANAKWKGVAERQEKKAIAAVEEVAAMETTLRAEQQAASKLRSTLYAKDKSAAALAAMRLHPDVVRSLQAGDRKD